MNPWDELDAIDARNYVRIERRFGICLVCRKPATRAESVSTVTWAACAACGTRWPVGSLLTPINDESVLAGVLAKLAEFQQLDGRQIQETTMAPKTDAKTDPQPHNITFDVHWLPPMPKHAGFPHPKDLLGGASVRQREIIGGHCLAILQRYPHSRLTDATLLANELWDNIRALTIDNTRDTIDSVLSARQIASPMTELRDILRLMMAAGDLRTTLIRQRDQIDATLAQLDALKEIAR